MRTRRALPLAAVLALCAACAACASGRRPAADAAARTIEATPFAPGLNIDLAAMTRTESGLYVRDLYPGEGRPVGRGAQVLVRYAGWLADGTPFDSTPASAPPITFRLGAREVIAGWDEGILGMRVGGQRQLVIPPRLGYGSRWSGPIPPNSVLVFIIDLVGVR